MINNLHIDTCIDLKIHREVFLSRGVILSAHSAFQLRPERMAVFASSAEMMAQNFLASLSFLPKMDKNSQDQTRGSSVGNSERDFHQGGGVVGVAGGGENGVAGVGRAINGVNSFGQSRDRRKKSGEGKNSWKAGHRGKHLAIHGGEKKTSAQWCDICKITLNAPDQLEQHFAGGYGVEVPFGRG